MMEMFLIYVVTRLTDFKDMLSTVSLYAGILLGAAFVLRLVNEFFTSPETKDNASKVEGEVTNAPVFVYLGIRRTTKRGMWWFAPVFVLTFGLNMLLPTTRDAVMIAGGYGIVEAVKNERVQQLFAKSAKVTSQWLDAQLNGSDKTVQELAEASTSAASASSEADSASSPKK
jgi:hypothetical protein